MAASVISELLQKKLSMTPHINFTAPNSSINFAEKAI